MTQLRALNLSSNSLTGADASDAQLVTTVLELTSAIHSSCSLPCVLFAGTLCPGWSKMRRLQSLRLNSNLLEGTNRCRYGALC